MQGVTDEELDELGISSELYNRPSFIRRGTRLPFADCFDARFFGFTPREAEMMDPQNRVFLETCYGALENAGYDPNGIDVPVGLFAGSNPNDYASLLGVADPSDSLSAFDQLIGSDKDFLATRVAHKLNLKGPVLTLQTACSTSLVAVHMAVQSLLNYESTICLAGGVTVNLRQGVGYFYQDGMILSPEGKCRAFDANASGTTLGQGCGVAVMKRLDEALEDGDYIYAVIRGSAVNNDGADKVSFTAPSESGQAEVIAMAHELADVESDSIGYVEAHGTGTKLGDPVEIAGLTRAFAPGTDRTTYCAIGSAKTNFGHTDAAAGITGFLKTVMCLHHKKLVPSLHFEKPNPDMGIDNTPFYVNTKLRDWPRPTSGEPRRAGVSAFGIGGTNAHIVLEEAPLRESKENKTQAQLLPISAKSPQALDEKIADLENYLNLNERVNPSDVAFTLRSGRPEFTHRAALVVGGSNKSDNTSVVGKVKIKNPKLIWMYSGQGSQYPGMGLELYKNNTAFTTAVDLCAELFRPLIKCDIRELIFAESGLVASEKLRQTAITQPALFTIEYALSQMLHTWGFKPDAVIGHSIGEFAAATEAGIVSLDDAVKLVFERGRLMQSMEHGAMLSVSMVLDDLLEILPNDLELAAENSQAQCVVSGPFDSIEKLRAAFESSDVDCRLLETSHAFHSRMMKLAASQFEAVLRCVQLNRPCVPMMSNVTGQWLSDEEAISPGFWASQITSTVRFGMCISGSRLDNANYLEVGPGRVLATLAKRNTDIDARKTVITHLLPHPGSHENAHQLVLQSIGKLWCAGHSINWENMGEGSNKRVPLPGYPFSRTRYWGPSRQHVQALPCFGEQDENYQGPVRKNPIDRWLYTPSWKRISIPPRRKREKESVRVLYVLDTDMGKSIRNTLSESSPTIVVVPGEHYQELEYAKSYSVDPRVDEHIDTFFEHLQGLGIVVDHIIHAWLVGQYCADESFEALENTLSLGVLSAHACGRAAGRIAKDSNVLIDFLTCGAQQVFGDELIRPEAAALLGPAKVIPLEFPGVQCRHIDMEYGVNCSYAASLLKHVLESDVLDTPPVYALRGKHVWQYRVEELTLHTGLPSILKQGGCYMIVGGLGGVGLSLCQYLVDNYNAKVVLTSRSGRPSRSSHDSIETKCRLDLLEQLEKTADRLMVLSADISDEAAMRAVVEKVELEFGTIDGVVVAAGVADYAGAIHRRTREQAIDAISSKVHGSLSLTRIFKNKNPDFMLFSSSIASMLYHNRFGQVGYVTANSYVEAFAIKAQQQGLNAITVAWDDWKELGMSVRAAADFSETYGSKINLVDEIHSFTPEEGVEIFKQAIDCGEPLLYVSTTDLNLRMQRDVDVVSPFLEQALAGGELGDTETALEQPSIEMLRTIWSDLLGYDSFDDTDDFFDLGGDSLQAARLADRLTRALSIEVPLNTIFDKSKFSELATELEKLVGKGQQSGGRKALSGMFVLGPAQLRFLSRMSPNPNHFNISVLLQGSEAIDVEKLQESLKLLVEHHDSLRFRLRQEGELIYQECLSASDVPLVLERFKVGDDEKTLAITADEIQSGLDLWQGPVFRAAFLERGAKEPLLLLVVHHMVSDRISLFLLMDGLNQLYQSLISDEVPHLASRTFDYAQWIAGLGAYIDNNRKLIDKWSAYDWSSIKKIPVSREYEQSLNSNKAAANVKIRLTGELAISILKNDYARPDEILLIALGKAIAEWTASNSALIETLSHGRRILQDVDVSRTTGFFLTYMPLLLSFDSKQSLPSRVKHLRQSMQDAWTFDIIKNNHPEDDVRAKFSSLPRAEVLFNFVGREIVAEKSAFFNIIDKPRGRESDPAGLRDHMIAVRADVVNDVCIDMSFVYSTRFHDKEQLEWFSARVLEILSEWV